MSWEKPKPLTLGPLRRASVVLGIAGLTAGGMILGAGIAQAHVGKNPGAVMLNPATGQTSGTPTWSTTTGCAAGFQGSAVFRGVESDGTTTDSISQAVNGTANAFSGTLQGSIAQIQTLGLIPNGGTEELVVICFSGPSLTGTSDPEMDIAIHYSADGTTYTTDTNFGGGGGGALSTTTTLTAAPNPATVGQTVTLTATETASDSSHPGGSVQFEAGGTNIGSAVPVDSTGKATTTTSFAAAGSQSLSAVFTPTNTTSFNGSTGTFTENVQQSGGGGGNSGSEPLAVTIGASGSFSLTVATGTVNLTVSGSNATGALNPITVADTRNNAPGWSVTGQAADFTGPGTISGNQLGWMPTDTSLATGATLGGTVAPGTPGLGSTAAVLAQAHAGSGAGSSALGANLTLGIPTTTPGGTYASSLTVTAVTSLP
jgi:hypothetical protein